MATSAAQPAQSLRHLAFAAGGVGLLVPGVRAADVSSRTRRERTSASAAPA